MFGLVEATFRRLSERGSGKTFLAPALLALGGTCLGVLVLLGAEAVARRVAPDYLVRARGIHVFSSEYGWAGRPLATAPMGGGRVTLNARGYRGQDLSQPKTADQKRVIVLGDSIAFGYGVADGEAFPRILHVRDNGLEVANLGMEGYGPGQELLVLRREGLATHPDVVLLAVCLRNDFIDAVLPVALYDGVTPRPRFRLVEGAIVYDDGAMPKSRAARALRWLTDESHLFNRLSALVPRSREDEDPGWRHRKQEVLRDADYAFRLTLALVTEMEEACRVRGIRFLVATFPNGLGYGIKPEIAERFHQALEASGIPFVEMGARFRSLGLNAKALAIDSTGHLGPHGHALAARILEPEIVRLVSGPPTGE